MFALGLGPIYTLRNRIQPLPAGQYIDDARVNAAFVVLYLVVIAALARRVPRLSRPTTVLLVALHVLVIASALWSLAPGRSATQGLLFALTTMTAVVVGDRIGVRGLLLALAVAAQVGVVLSQLAVRRSWPNTIDGNGDWSGIYLNRNSLGPVAMLALLATFGAMALWWQDRDGATSRSSRDVGLGAALGGALVVLVVLDVHTLLRSASLTPVVGAVVAALTVIVAVLAPALQQRFASGRAASGGPVTEQGSPWPLVAAVVATWAGVAVVAMVGRSQVATNLDRSSTLSGRTELWGWLIDAISRRPFGGWGWLGVWEDRALEAEVVARFNVDFSTAHNAVIEMLLATGVFGALLLVATVGALIRPAVQLTAHSGGDRRLGVVTMGLVGYVVAVNQLETYVGANLLPWALLVGGAATCARTLADDAGSDRAAVPNPSRVSI